MRRPWVGGISGSWRTIRGGYLRLEGRLRVGEFTLCKSLEGWKKLHREERRLNLRGTKIEELAGEEKSADKEERKDQRGKGRVQWQRCHRSQGRQEFQAGGIVTGDKWHKLLFRIRTNFWSGFQYVPSETPINIPVKTQKKTKIHQDVENQGWKSSHGQNQDFPLIGKDS